MNLFISIASQDFYTIMDHIGNYSLQIIDPELLVHEKDYTKFIHIFRPFAICFVIYAIAKSLRLIFLGKLRTSELKIRDETLQDYLFQKALFVMLISVSANPWDKWVFWFSSLGALLILSRLCKHRAEYLISSSPSTPRWPLVKIGILLSLLQFIALTLNVIVFTNKISKQSIFLLVDSTYVLVFVTSVMTKFLILIHDMRKTTLWENSENVNYYSELFFAMSLLTIESIYNLIGVNNHSSLMMKFFCVVRITTLVKDIKKRLRKHKHHLFVTKLMEGSFAMADKEDIEKNSDYCAICWNEMTQARKLPCNHLFHNCCLRSWLERDTTCPTCRKPIKGQSSHQRANDQLTMEEQLDDINEGIIEESESSDEFIDTTNQHNPPTVAAIRAHQRAQMIQFESARLYTNVHWITWLPRVLLEDFITLIYS